MSAVTKKEEAKCKNCRFNRAGRCGLNKETVQDEEMCDWHEWRPTVKANYGKE